MKAILLVGPICAGKTKLAEKLIEKGFIKKKSNFYSIEQNRYTFGNNLMSGEMFAWANFLQQIEEPPTNDNVIYEFSGTGKNVFNVSSAMKYSKESNPEINWLVVYCLAPENIILARYPNKTYDAPMPYKFDNPTTSLQYMNTDLKKSYDNSREWNSSPRIKLNMNVETYDGLADHIINYFKGNENGN